MLSAFRFLCLPVMIGAIVGCQTTSPAPKINAETAKIAEDIPIADLHLHPDSNLSPEEVRKRMDKNGVHWAGAGVTRGGRAAWERYAKELGDRFIPFGGQYELNVIYKKGGMAAMLDDKNADILALYAMAEKDLKGGQIKGIGEIFINNERSHPQAWFRRKGPTDAPSMRLFYDLISKYDGFLTFHMHGDSDSMKQLDALLESDRKGRILLNHCGVDADAKVMRKALQRHPNVYCEISVRYPPVLKIQWPTYYERLVFDDNGIGAEWLKLIEDFPDRFMIGTDAHDAWEYDGAIYTVRKGLLPYLSPQTARMIAFENAKGLFKLK